MIEFLELLRVSGEKKVLKINVEKTKGQRLEISEIEKVMFGNEKINQLDSFTYLGSIITKDGGCSKDVKSRIVKDQDFFFS